MFGHGRNRMVHALLSGREVGRLLDYGCGNASFAVGAASELGLTVLACDIDFALIQDLQRRHGADLEFFTVSETEPRLPLDDGQVDAITCCEVLEHMPPATREAALREMHRVLADDGVLILTVPHKSLLSAADPENAKVNFPRSHKYVYTLAKGRDRYELTYGGKRFGNFSAGARRHVHFSARELAHLLSVAGFQAEEVRYFRPIYPLVRTLLWLTESLEGRVWGMSRAKAWCWSIYTWDADYEPRRRLACSIAIRARREIAPRSV